MVWVLGLAKLNPNRPMYTPTYIYPLPYPYPIHVPDGFGYPRSIPALNNFFKLKIDFFFCNQEQCCNTLSNNMHTLTFVRSNDLVSPLNINDSFYNMTIIKQNNMAYQHKVIFYIWDGFGYEYLYICYPSHTRILKSGKTQTQSKQGKPVKLSLVWAGNRVYGFCCRVYYYSSRLLVKRYEID